MVSTIIGEGNGTPLQYSCLENPIDGGARKTAVHGVAEGRTWLSDFPFTFHFHSLEKEMATHSSVLAWRIPGMGEPTRLPSMGSHRVGHNWSNLAAAAAGSNFYIFSSIASPSYLCSVVIFFYDFLSIPFKISTSSPLPVLLIFFSWCIFFTEF